ncbi:hypothetical protein, partial [Actinotalea sp. JY-7885]|uniref:hypothetical protein n=1 Tax=Actinotalea sp. JY-7885 TaxID=2758576 RepID=UPI001CB70729
SPEAAGPTGPEVAMPLQAESGVGRMAADSLWVGAGRTVFTSQGLPTEAGVAPAWGLDASAVLTAEAVAAAAAALGVSGTPEQVDGTWSVGPRDGSGAGVTVHPDGMATLSYYDPAKDPWTCSAAAVDGTAEGEVTTLPAPCEPGDLGPAPSGDAAAAALRETLTALGEDSGAYEIVAEELGDEAWTHVTAHRVLDGLRTGLTWSASFSGAGMQSLYGSLAPLVDLGELAVVSPAEAVERLTDPRFGGGGGGSFRTLQGGAAVMAEPMPTELAPPSAPPALEPGAAIAWPVEEVKITDFRLGPALHLLPNGAAALLPTYELISDDGAVWTVLAVATEHLDLSPLG